MKIILLFLLAILFYAPAEYYSKLFGQNPTITNGLLLQTGYIFSTFIWMWIVYIKKDLFVASLAWLGIGITISFVIGVLMFGETLKTINIVGAVLAIIASILLMI